MSSKSGLMPPHSESVTVPFRTKSNQPERFMALFREGMTLVEATANYLDGLGRREAKTLTPFVALAYATESMRLTTRLTQMATWLLARRAVFNGEELPNVGSPNDPLIVPPMTRTIGSKGYDELPETLRSLIDASHQLHAKIHRFDAADREAPKIVQNGPNPVALQVARLAAVFNSSDCPVGHA
jgi:regulator of CtrA degradation